MKKIVLPLSLPEGGILDAEPLVKSGTILHGDMEIMPWATQRHGDTGST